MRVAKHLLNLCDQFYAAVSPIEQQRNQGLNLLLRKIKANIKNGLAGFSEDQERMLIEETADDLDELMDQISKEERARNPKLRKRFNEIQDELADLQSDMETEWEDDEAENEEDEECEKETAEEEDDSDSDHEEEDDFDEEDSEDDTDEEESCVCGLCCSGC
jgi:hypothetical protein